MFKFLRKLRAENGEHSNSIDDVKDLVKGHIFNTNGYPACKPFFIGVEYDQNNEPIIRSGLNNEPTRLAITSKELLESLIVNNDYCVYQLDTTHKTNKNRFPCGVLSRTDFSGTVTPIAVSIQSNEKEEDFTWFLEAIKSWANYFGVRASFYIY